MLFQVYAVSRILIRDILTSLSKASLTRTYIYGYVSYASTVAYTRAHC